MRVGQEVQEVPRGLAAGLAIAAIATVAIQVGAGAVKAAVGDDLRPRLRFQPQRYRPGRGRDPDPRAPRYLGDRRRERRLRARGPRRHDRDAVHRASRRLSPDRPADVPHPGQPDLNANFQTPADAEYNGFAALLQVPLGPDGRPEQCVVVTTASARNVRGVDFETFQARTPHGVAGATARTYPFVTRPIYFNDQVIPDRSRTLTSGDGGDHLDRHAGGRLSRRGHEPDDSICDLPRHLRAGADRQRQPTVGPVRVEPGRAPARGGPRRRRGRECEGHGAWRPAADRRAGRGGRAVAVEAVPEATRRALRRSQVRARRPRAFEQGDLLGPRMASPPAGPD